MILAYLWLRWRVRRFLAAAAAPAVTTTVSLPGSRLAACCGGARCPFCGWSGWE